MADTMSKKLVMIEKGKAMMEKAMAMPDSDKKKTMIAKAQAMMDKAKAMK